MKKKNAHLVKAAVGADKMYNPEGDKCCTEVNFE
jgi:hypothetical protein